MATTFTNDSDAAGRRVRLRPKPNAVSQIYGSGIILQPLRNTNGLVFPYQPTIGYAQDVQYQSVDLVHTNQEMYAYTRTNAVKLTVSGQFSVQNQTEGLYSLACIHFLKTVTKMYFGASATPGTPPPVLLFDAYGQFLFNSLPVIVTNFSVGLPNDVDYVPVDVSNIVQSNNSSSNMPSNTQSNPMLSSISNNANPNIVAQQLLASGLNSSDGYVWLPSLFNIDVSITVQNIPTRLRQFDLDQFRSGALLSGGMWI